MPTFFENESAFRNWLCEELCSQFGEEWRVVMGKNVADILVSRQDEGRPVLIFLEVKYHKKIHGRISIGNQGGTGYQMEYLLNKMPYLERYLRWVVGDEASDAALILTNEQVRMYPSGGLRVGKQNNLQKKIFREMRPSLIKMAELPERLVKTIREMIT